MISTATAAPTADAAPAPAASHATRVAAASAMTTGTKTAETRSASRCTGALPDCASATSRAICDSAVSAPTRVARTSRRPPALMVAPVTASPGPTSTGTLSPVSSDALTADEPASTTPSVAIRSPGRTRKRSPGRSSEAGTRTSRPSSSSSDASLAPSSRSAASAAPARRLARASSQRPARRAVVTTAATSR